MSRDPVVYLEHMPEAARKICAYTEDMTYEYFFDDGMAQDAVVRNLEIIGEAAKRVPTDIAEMKPDIEWREIRGFRDVIAHDHDTIDLDVVWDAARNEIPDLIGGLEELLDELRAESENADED